VLGVLGTSPTGSAASAQTQEAFELGDPPETRYRLAPFLTGGAEIEAEYTFRRNRDLDSRREDDTSILEPELSLAFSFDPHPSLQAFLNFAVSQSFILAQGVDGAGERHGMRLQLKEAFVLARALPGGLGLQVGRQKFEDEREWLYDEELDAVRLLYGRGPVAVEASVSRKGLVQTDLPAADDRERINNYVLLGRYQIREELDLEGYVIFRDHQGVDRRRPLWAGVRSRGEAVEDLDYWVELAYVGGRDGREQIAGWGVDLGATYEVPVPWKPALTLGFAFGSGDRDPNDRHDRSFRQTDLHDNRGDFGGAASFKYYGETLDPDLNNLLVFTAGVGVRPQDTLSLDLVYHHYRQHRKSTSLGAAEIDAEPSGRDRTLGNALDLVFGVEGVLDRIDAKAVVGCFIPGAAFPGGADPAWIVNVEVQFRF
jgi:alginate production protein